MAYSLRVFNANLPSYSAYNIEFLKNKKFSVTYLNLCRYIQQFKDAGADFSFFWGVLVVILSFLNGNMYRVIPHLKGIFILKHVGEKSVLLMGV